MAAILALGTGPLTAFAAGYQNIDDTCDQGGPNNGQFYADGPPQYWHTASFSGGPDGCMMWTYNEYIYNAAYGNEAFYYNNISPGFDGNYDVYPFIPSVNASTTNAVYQWWANGHSESRPSGAFYLNQNNIYNQYWTLATNVYLSASQGGFFLMQDGTGENAGSTKVGYDNVGFNPYPY